MAPEAELLPGTLDLLILKAVSLGAEHGYGVLLRIEHITGNALTIEQGALYPALYRLEHQGLLDTEWGTSDNNRKAKFYQPHGRRPKAPEGRNRTLESHHSRREHGTARTGGVMALRARLRSFWRSVLHRSDMERNMSDELQFHLERRAEDLHRARRPLPAGSHANRAARVRIRGEIQGRGSAESRPEAVGRIARRPALCVSHASAGTKALRRPQSRRSRSASARTRRCSASSTRCFFASFR